MSGRSVTTLLNTACVFDVRPHTGSAKDWSTGGHVPSWTGGANDPTFKRGVGQVVGLDFKSPQGLSYTGALTGPTSFAFEATMLLRSLGAGVSMLWNAAPVGPSGIYTNVGDARLGVWFGSVIYTRAPAAGGWTINGIPYHVVLSVVSGTGTIHVNGAFDVSGAVGANVPTTIVLGNSAPGAGNGMDGQLYQARIFNTSIDPDEALALYESSRVRLWPGAQKRSGITSRIV